MGMTQAGCGALANLRNDGWLVASHNDYEIDATGERRTYWSFTHPDISRYLDGDGPTDDEALLWCCLRASVLEGGAWLNAGRHL